MTTCTTSTTVTSIVTLPPISLTMPYLITTVTVIPLLLPLLLLPALLLFVLILLPNGFHFVIFEFPRRHSTAKRRAPSCSRALCLVRMVFQRCTAKSRVRLTNLSPERGRSRFTCGYFFTGWFLCFSYCLSAISGNECRNSMLLDD